MKEGIKAGILLFLVVVFALFFASTRGNDELNLNIEWPTIQKGEAFSFPVYGSEYNGQYKNNAGNGIYAFVGKNSDDTYKVYFIETIKSVKNVILKLDNVRAKDGVITFYDTTNSSVKDLQFNLIFGSDSFSVKPAQIGLTNEKIDGYYAKHAELDLFSLSEFKY